MNVLDGINCYLGRYKQYSEVHQPSGINFTFYESQWIIYYGTGEDMSRNIVMTTTLF